MYENGSPWQCHQFLLRQGNYYKRKHQNDLSLHRRSSRKQDGTRYYIHRIEPMDNALHPQDHSLGHLCGSNSLPLRISEARLPIPSSLNIAKVRFFTLGGMAVRILFEREKKIT